MQFEPSRMALVVTDPQNEVLSESGKAWPFVAKTVTQNNTVENMELLMRTAHEAGIPIFVSPHYYYPADDAWMFRDPLGAMMHRNHMFARKSALSLEDFPDSGADWLERLRPLIEHPGTVVVSPHKIYGPETNDLVLQLRKRGITTVFVFGMLANMCVEAHVRELLEQGFEVGVVADATAAASHPEWGEGYEAALINFRFLANEVLTAEKACGLLRRDGLAAKGDRK
jgi:nicotinamidase-related amidase